MGEADPLGELIPMLSKMDDSNDIEKHHYFHGQKLISFLRRF